MSYTDESENEKPTFTCAVCNTTWKTKKSDGPPQRCPHCKSKLWNQCFKHKCLKCNYRWLSSNPSPGRCPNCQSEKWSAVKKETHESSNSANKKDLRRFILLRYSAGMGCLKISIDLNVTFSDVYDVIKDVYPEQEVKI